MNDIASGGAPWLQSWQEAQRQSTRAPPVPATGRPRILLVSLYHPELIRGGAQQVTYELFQELRLRDDLDVYLLASVDSTYPALFKAGARITGFDGRPNEFLFLSCDFDHWYQKVGSPLHIAAFQEFLETIRPDIVHFHHFMTLGVDLLTLTRRTLPECRLIFTFHEFLSICAAHGHMVRTQDRSLCTHASPVRCHQCFPDRAPEQFLMRKMWFMHHFAAVDHFTCPSRFMIEHYVTWGIPREKISWVTNGQRDYSGGERLPPSARRNRFGFFGQFVDAKGVHILLRAVALLRAEGFEDFAVELNGDNLRYASPAVREEIEAFLLAEAALPADRRLVVNNGSYHVDMLRGRMARVDWCVVPSVWWEIFGLVISEAWMFGRPVICSNVGGMAERNEDGVFALQFEMGDHRALAETMRRACTEEGIWDRLREALPEPPSRSAMTNRYCHDYLHRKKAGTLEISLDGDGQAQPPKVTSRSEFEIAVAEPGCRH